MKKNIQLSFAIVMILTLITGLFLFAPDLQTNVGWNRNTGLSPSQGLSLAYCGTCVPLDSGITPNVGWNRKG
jgi:hypothetical protein